MNRHLRPALFLVAACSALAGGVVLVLPPAIGHPAVDPIPSDGKPLLPPLTPADPALAEELVLANAFSPSRTPPTMRYTPPEASLDSSGGVLAGASAADTVAADAGTPILMGTVVGARGRQALLQLDPYAGAPRLYAEGERDGGFRIVSITPGSVVLAGPRGRLTLRLDPQEERP